MNVKNLVIIILLIAVVLLSIFLYRATRVSRTLEKLALRVPETVPVDVFVIGMTEAVQQQNQICSELTSQVWWLRRHLEKTLDFIEKEKNFEPIFIIDPLMNRKLLPSEYLLDPGPFVIPYQKPEYKFPDDSRDEYGLEALRSFMNLHSRSSQLAAGQSMEMLIKNFYTRLQRLDEMRK